MVAILLCHFNTVSVAWHECLKYLTPGFIGVDFFIFFSGWSLCYSWEKNSVTCFFKRRLTRIMPLYIVFAVIVTVLFITLRGDFFSFFDWICNLTTLNYWGIGGAYIDWYLPAILVFYILFPIVFYIVKKTELAGACLVLFLSGLLLLFTDFHWRYNAAIARIPIFSLGVLFFIDKSEKKTQGISGSLIFLVVAIFLIVFKSGFDGIFLTNCIAACIILFISLVLPLTKRHGIKSIEFIGAHSLEIYVSHIISCWIIELIQVSQLTVLFLYLVLNFGISCIMILFNKYLSKYIIKLV